MPTDCEEKSYDLEDFIKSVYIIKVINRSRYIFSKGKTDGEIKKAFFDCQEKCKNEDGSWEEWCSLAKICTPRFNKMTDSLG